LISALAFASVASAAVALGLLLPSRARRARGGAVERGPAALRLAARIGARFARRAGQTDVQRRIAAAGSPVGIGPRELLAAKLGSAISAGAIGAVLGAALPGRLGILVVVVAPVAGFMAPDLWLARRAEQRARAVRAQLPQLLDVLRVTVEAGLSLPAALRAVGDQADGPLAASWATVGRATSLGVPLEQALADMADRLPLAEVRVLAGALDRTRRHGVPLAQTLAAQAADARLAIARQVREEAARAGPKIQLVVALLLVPSVLLLVAAALVAALVGSGGADLGGWG
jgi:tight adherence protein C